MVDIWLIYGWYGWYGWHMVDIWLGTLFTWLIMINIDGSQKWIIYGYGWYTLIYPLVMLNMLLNMAVGSVSKAWLYHPSGCVNIAVEHGHGYGGFTESKDSDFP